MSLAQSQNGAKPGIWNPPAAATNPTTRRGVGAYLALPGETYTMRFLGREHGDDIDGPTIRLTRDTKIVHVARENGRVRCTCENFSDRTERGCDHVAALRALGALDALGWSTSALPAAPHKPRNRVFGEGLL